MEGLMLLVVVILVAGVLLKFVKGVMRLIFSIGFVIVLIGLIYLMIDASASSVSQYVDTATGEVKTKIGGGLLDIFSASLGDIWYNLKLKLGWW